MKRTISVLKSHKLLLIILIIASLLRFIGTNPGHNRYHNDEPIVYGTAIEMVQNHTLDPKRFDYPGGSIYINYVAFRYLFIPVQWFFYYLTHIPQIIDGVVHLPISQLEKDRLFTTYILGGNDFYPLFWGRYITALFGVGNVLLIYLLGKEMFEKRVGLIAALLLAVNFRQILNSHIGLPDIYNAFFLLLACIFAIKLWKNPSKRNYLFAGIAGGLSFSMKYQFFGLLPIFFVHLYVSFESKSFISTFFDKRAFFFGLIALIVFMIFNPYFFIHFETAKMWIQSVSQRYGVGVDMFSFFPLSYLYHYDYGAVEAIIAVIGIFFTFFKYPKRTIILFSAIIPFMASLLYFSRGGFYVRNFVTITPLILLFAAIVLNQLYKFRRFVLFLILPFALWVPVVNSVTHTYYYTKPWDYSLLTAWMNKNFPANQVVAAKPFDPPTGSPLMKKTEFELGGSYSMAEHADDGAKYALSNSDWTADAFFFWMSYGFKDLRQYWNKPLKTLRNTFFGLAIEEHFRYQIFSAVKTWQSPDEALVLSKIPVWPNTDFKQIKTFSFDKDKMNWTVRNNEPLVSATYVYDGKVGHKNNGSLVLVPGGSNTSTIRISSEPINIKEGYLYRIGGYLKSDSVLTSRSRNGFIRVDFYSDNDFDNVGVISAISSRVYGTDDWVKKSVMERAPEGTKYMLVSFQTSDSNVGRLWLDDVSIEESLKPVDDITMKEPYTRKKIDLDLLYTNSHGNL